MPEPIIEREVWEAFKATGREDRIGRWLARTNEALGFFPDDWYPDGLTIGAGNDWFGGTNDRRIATIRLPNRIHWRPRFLGYATRGITAHESMHLFQLQPGPGKDAILELEISRNDQMRLAYNGNLIEGIPYIIQRAMGTQPGWERLREEEPTVTDALLTWFNQYHIQGPTWIQKELPMTVAPDIPADFPATTYWVPAHASNQWPAPHYGMLRTNIKGLCFHTPEEPADDRESTPVYFGLATSNASTHYYADDDGDLYQMVLDKDFPWAQGTRSVDAIIPRPKYYMPKDVSYNAIYLSIEVEGFAASIGRTMFEGSLQFETVCQWAALKAREYVIPINRQRFVGHNELNKQKHDPGVQFPWDALMQRTREITGMDWPKDFGYGERLAKLEGHTHPPVRGEFIEVIGRPIYPDN